MSIKNVSRISFGPQSNTKNFKCMRSSGDRSFPSNTQHLLDSCHFSKHALIKLPAINKCVIFDGKYEYNYVLLSLK